MNQELFKTNQNIVELFETINNAKKFSKALVIQLSLLLKNAVELEPIFVNLEIGNTSFDSEKVRQNLERLFEGENLYKQVFDPINDDEFVTFSLVNDLCEIYECLKTFLYHSSLNHDFAEWEFKEAFRAHLFQHVLNAIKVLYMEYCKDE